ncbi:MAG: phage holin family protein [Candidatus Wildermuthbacteria bacterium]|nr:phage holin family protein [Candidatus Wildermuthbacteria bacterium]
MLRALLFDIASGILGIWLASRFIEGVQFAGSLQTLLIAGTALGIVFALVRPFLRLLAFLFRIIILLGVSVGVVWVLTIYFPALTIHGFMPLFWTAVAVSAISLLATAFSGRSD